MVIFYGDAWKSRYLFHAFLATLEGLGGELNHPLPRAAYRPWHEEKQRFRWWLFWDS